MIAKNDRSVTERFMDITVIRRAMKNAVDDARKLHAAHGVPMVTMRDGKIVEVDPVTLEVVRVVEDQPDDDPAEKPAANDAGAD